MVAIYKTKKCSKCKEIKFIDDFNKCKTIKDGYRTSCKMCAKQYYNDNKDKIKETKKQHYNDNKEHYLKRSIKYYNDNKELISKKRKHFRDENKELISYRKICYNNKNRDYNIHQSKQYRRSFALYDPYAHQLTIEEEPKLSDDGRYLEVRCKYCGKYFKPTNSNICDRIKSINGKSLGENSLYCSDSCKKLCGTYKKRKYPDGFKINTSREVQPALRKLVLERDNYKCQKCDSGKELHCHHYEGIEINPVESADVDNCVTLCKKCHKEAHKQDGCGYKELKCH